jgi:hypothetical protein
VHNSIAAHNAVVLTACVLPTRRMGTPESGTRARMSGFRGRTLNLWVRVWFGYLAAAHGMVPVYVCRARGGAGSSTLAAHIQEGKRRERMWEGGKMPLPP